MGNYLGDSAINQAFPPPSGAEILKLGHESNSNTGFQIDTWVVTFMANFSAVWIWSRGQELVVGLLQRRFIKFGIVGFMGTVLNLGVLALGQEYLFVTILDPRLRLNVSLTLAMSLAILHNFIWNQRWTWGDRSSGEGGILRQFRRYLLASTFGIIIQFILTNTLTTHIHYLLANATAVVITAVINYLINNIWTFRRR